MKASGTYLGPEETLTWKPWRSLYSWWPCWSLNMSESVLHLCICVQHRHLEMCPSPRVIGAPEGWSKLGSLVRETENSLVSQVLPGPLVLEDPLVLEFLVHPEN